MTRIEALPGGAFTIVDSLVVVVRNAEAADHYRTKSVYLDDERKLAYFTASIAGVDGRNRRRAKAKHFTERSPYDGFSLATSGTYREVALPMPEDYPATITISSRLELSAAASLPPAFWYAPEGAIVRHGALVVTDAEGVVKHHLVDPGGRIRVQRRGTETSFSVSDIAHDDEAYRHASIYQQGPLVALSLASGSVDGVAGAFVSWADMARWKGKLVAERSALPPAARAELEKLLAGATTDAERVERIYRFVQQRSHYVSVQLGIGGWQPMAPAEVHDTGYGDCKALSNYTRLLLEAAGIDAHYALIGVGDREILFPEFASFYQTNHAIVAVPMGADTAWLECTSQITPPGFLGASASGRYALLIDHDGDTGGTLVRTPGVDPADNLTRRQYTLQLSADGTATLHQTAEVRGDAVRVAMRLASDDANARRYALRELTGPSVTDPKLEVEPPAGLVCPRATYALSGTLPAFAKPVGPALMVPAFAALPTATALRELRDSEGAIFQTESSYAHADSLVYELPAGMSATDLPGAHHLESPLGTYDIAVSAHGDRVVATRRLTCRRVSLTGEDLRSARAFAEEVLRTDNVVFGVVPQ